MARVTPQTNFTNCPLILGPIPPPLFEFAHPLKHHSKQDDPAHWNPVAEGRVGLDWGEGLQVAVEDVDYVYHTF